MTRTRIAAVFAALVLGAASLAAQGATPAKKSNPVRDSLKAVSKDIKADRAERKAAKAAGDTAKAKATTKDIKQDERKRGALKQQLGKKKSPPAKKP